MRWIKKMNPTFHDGHDELYHHAKFGEDRTMRAGCRCENVVFVCLFVFYRQDAAKRQTAGIKFTQAKNQVFRPHRGHSLHRFRPNLSWPTGT